jgi:hypothetical protein
MRSFIIILICIALTGVVLYLAGLWDHRNRLMHEQPKSGASYLLLLGTMLTSISLSSLVVGTHIFPKSMGYLDEYIVALFGITLGLMCIFWVLQAIWLNQGNKRRNSR